MVRASVEPMRNSKVGTRTRGYVTTMEKNKDGEDIPFKHKSRLYAKEITKKDANGVRRLKMTIYQKQMVYYSEKYAKNRNMKGKKPL